MTRTTRRADERFFRQAISEALDVETPPDLRAALRAASPTRGIAAAARVDRGAGGHRAVAWRAAAALFALVALAAVALTAAPRGAASAPGQDPGPTQGPTELAPADPAALGALPPQVAAVALVARRDAGGAPLPDEPEHAEVLTDPTLRAALLAALAGGQAAPAFGLAEAQAELVLHLGDHRLVRGRLRLSGDAARFGTAAFARAGDLPPAVAAGLRAAWQRLAAARVPPRRRVLASDLRSFVAALGSDRTIELAGDGIELDRRDAAGELPANPAVVFSDSGGAPTLCVQGVRNLRVVARGAPVRLLGRSPDAVLTFASCEGVQLEGLVVGHVQKLEFSCSAPVVVLERCRAVRLRRCELFGCGTEGVVASDCTGVEVALSEIHTCRLAVASFRDCTGVRFAATLCRDCAGIPAAFTFADCREVAFADCTLRGLDAQTDGTLFDVRMDEAVRFDGGAIRGNRCRKVANSKLLLARTGVDERDNGPDVVPVPAEASSRR